MKKLRQINFLFVVLALLLVNCNRTKIKSGTDYDQLYAVWYSDEYKDSLAETLKPSVEKALSVNNTPKNRVFIDSVLSQLRWTRDSVSFKALSHKALKYAKNDADHYMTASIYNDIGMYYHDLKQLDSTFYYYIKAENIYKEFGDSVRIGEMEFYQARVLFEQGLYMESEVKIARSLHILRNETSNPVPFEANQMMSICLYERKDYEMAMSYLLQALALMNKDLDTNQVLDSQRLNLALTMLYGNLSSLSFKLGEYKQASQYAFKGLDYVEDTTHPLLTATLVSRKAEADLMIDIKNNNFTKLDQYFEKIEYNYQVAKSVSNYFFEIEAADILANLYLEVNDSVKAFSWANVAYQRAVEQNLKPLQKQILEFIVIHKEYENKEQVGDIIKLNNELVQLDYATRNRFARIAYETEKITSENNILRSMILKIGVTSLVIILGLSVGVFIYRLRNKNKELLFIKQQQKADESIYQLILEKSTIATETKNLVRNKIARDIHDGVVNGIFTIRFNLQQLRTDNESLKNTLITELQQLEKDTRGISHSLINNELFKETKFLSLVEDLASLQQNSWNTIFQVEYSHAEELEELSAIDKVNTYFIIKEAVQNINKYAEASLCTISFIGDDNGIVIKIKDNGKGFDKHTNEAGIGIQSMKERALALKSELAIYSERGMGVEISFRIKNK